MCYNHKPMSIKKLFLFSLFTIFSTSIFSQILEPIKWSSSVNKISDTEYELVFSATIEKNWKLYSQEEPDGLGPLPTVFEFAAAEGNYELIGDVSEPKVEPYHDKVFDLDIKFFNDRADFKQRIRLLNKELKTISVSVDYMTCDDEKCIPADNKFTVPIEDKSSTTLFNKGNESQILDPVKWISEVNKISDTEYELVYKAAIEKDWHFYSQFSEDTTGLGPIATELSFKGSENNYELIGETSQSKTIETYEPAFEMNVSYFESEAVFKQKIKTKNLELNIIEAEIYYQVCNSERCLAPNVFEISTALNGEIIEEKNIEIDERSKALSNALDLNVTGWDKYEREDVAEKSNFTIFFLGFLGGLIALLTPCVFPMIPLTVSFFTKSAGDSKKGIANSVMYGFFIFLIYFLLSLPFHALDSLDPEILNNISTNVTLNIIFFIIFIAFAFSFFGYFELTLPQSWSASLDSKANSIGGLIGVFFMALTLAIVSFSCTGPILGTLLGSSLSSDAGATQLTMGMSGFGLALALPFTLFAMFPKWLNQLPKSGGWLNTVKVVLGFIEIALALKFLSNADLVEHWGLLKREVFIGLWIVTGIGLVLYLLGIIKFPHDGPKKKITPWRWSFIFLVFAFVCLLYTSPSPRDRQKSRMPSSA